MAISAIRRVEGFSWNGVFAVRGKTKQNCCVRFFVFHILNVFISVHPVSPPLTDFTKGELSDESNRRQNVSKLLRAMAFLRMDFGLTEEDMSNLSDRDGVLLALHLFQATALARSCSPRRYLSHQCQSAHRSTMSVSGIFAARVVGVLSNKQALALRGCLRRGTLVLTKPSCLSGGINAFAAQALPQMVPKTEVEFRANLGTAVSKSIELKNPSSKPIAYEVTLEGSTDFRAKGSEVTG